MRTDCWWWIDAAMATKDTRTWFQKHEADLMAAIGLLLFGGFISLVVVLAYAAGTGWRPF